MRTRARLLSGALRVLGEYGVDASVIDRVIAEAGVSRGTFYNYFRTNDELFTALAQAVSDEILNVVNPMASRYEDPAIRVACGVSSVIRLAIRKPLLARFLVKGGLAALKEGSLTTEVIPNDVRLGIATGRFTVPDERLAFDLILGPVLTTFETLLNTELPKTYPQALAQAVLQALGVNAEEANRCARMEFGEPVLPATSIFNQRPGDL
jgi:AcrR family transcriptional regulator